MSKQERFEYFIDEWDENDWYIKDNKTDEQFEYLEDVTKLLNQQDQITADLEAKLAEQKLLADNIIKAYVDENKKILEQLAEKEKDLIIKCRTIGVLIEKNEQKDQDKISFALERLEKVKELAKKEIKECNKLLQEEFEDDYYIQSVNARQSMCYEFKREIDNQIKQLKEGK